MSKLEDEIVREAAKKALKQMPEALAKYILESYLGYPTLELRDRPDLQCKAESIGVEVTCCDENKIFGWLRDIATGRLFTKKTKDSEAELFDYMYKIKLLRIQFYVHMPSKEQWKTLSDGYKKFYIQEAKNLMRARASSIMMSGSDSLKLIINIITDAVDGKMDKLPKYQQFDRMELFISVQLFALDDNSDVPLIHEMLQEHVFAKTPCFGAVHILIVSYESQSMALFTFTKEDVQKTKVSPCDVGKKVFEQYGIPDPRDPQRVLDKLNELDRRVDERICKVLKRICPDSAWDELWEGLKKKYPDRDKKEESDHGDQQQIP